MTQSQAKAWISRATCLGLLALFALTVGVEVAHAQQSGRPNLLYLLVDNLGMGEPSSYSGGQRAFLEGREKNSNREGFLYWMNDTLCGVK